jgi:DUF3089 family protein
MERLRYGVTVTIKCRMRIRRAGAILGLGVLAFAAACSGSSSSPTTTIAAATTTTTEAPNPYPGYRSQIYADPAHWVCRPDMHDACKDNMDATIVRADGSVQIEHWQPAANAPIDCFYVYPTISTDPGTNSGLVAHEDQEIFVTRQQAARLGSQCRVFAPVYRQVTLTALTKALTGTPIGADAGRIAYQDVLDAWKHYVANDNHGRGVVLIGHSQGANILDRLTKTEIDGNDTLRGRLVSALIIGWPVVVPANADVGGDFAHIPLCHAPGQIGCVINYSSFRATSPPPANSLFGRPLGGGPGKAACTNPAALGGGSSVLRPYFPTNGQSLPGSAPKTPQWVDPSRGVTIMTPFVTLPDFVKAECKETNGFSYLAISIQASPAEPRIHNVGGDLTPEWGLHLIDINVAMGDLVDLVGQQVKAYTHR